VYAKEDIAIFQNEISGHVQAIVLLLLTFQTYVSAHGHIVRVLSLTARFLVPISKRSKCMLTS
jgi:hypothetical protein